MPNLAFCCWGIFFTSLTNFFDKSFDLLFPPAFGLPLFFFCSLASIFYFVAFATVELDAIVNCSFLQLFRYSYIEAKVCWKGKQKLFYIFFHCNKPLILYFLLVRAHNAGIYRKRKRKRKKPKPVSQEEIQFKVGIKRQAINDLKFESL